MRFLLKNEKATAVLAKKLAARLRGGEIIALVGDLGAGKTTFTQSLARALGVKQTVNSPTFVVLKLYQARRRAIKNLVHIDVYRLDGVRDLAAIGWADFQDKNSVIVIEWADKAAALLPPSTIWLKFGLGRADSRMVTAKNFPQNESGQAKGNEQVR